MALSSSPPPPSGEVSGSTTQNSKTTQSTDSSPTNHHVLQIEPNHIDQQKNSSKSWKKSAAVINYACLVIGTVSATLINKFYFNHNHMGSNLWVPTWYQSAGFPLLLLPTFLPYHLFRSTSRPPFTGFTRRLTLMSMVVGILIGVSNYLISLGTSLLPVSTASLVLSSQLAFTLVLSVVMVKQKVTFTNLNCVILLTLGAVLVGLSSSSDRPSGLTHRNYLIGFFSTLGAGLTFAVYLPVMQIIYRKVYCYAMVVEMQLLTQLVATVFATVGMAAGGGFKALKTESEVGFDKGTAAYWWTIVGNMVVWQLSFLGTAGTVFLTTSLTGGIFMTALMAVNILAGVVVYGDKFGGVKAVATVICVWGFCSHVYGMYVKSKKLEESELNLISGNENPSSSYPL